MDKSNKNKDQPELKEKEKKIKSVIGSNTLIEIPETHFKGRNMWVLKAVNLNRGMCIKVVNSFQQMEKVINKFKSGVDYSNFTLEKIDEQDDNNQNDNLNKEKINVEEKNQSNINNKEKILPEYKEEKIYNCNKILIQKYIESPLLYKGRKCDMRIWVLLTHDLKLYLFKEGHLKTCSVEYNINDEDAFAHITNYSFQKHNSNFQKFEKGNEVPFYEFQKFIDETYPNKNYKLKRDLMKQLKDIIKTTMLCGKNRFNKNNRQSQFEVFGYDFMMDSDFNVFLIEINTNPGLEISSPWIQIIVPRMLDDALRLTVDKVFEPVYDFNKNHKEKLKEEDKIIYEKNKNKIEVDFNAVDIKIENNNDKKDENDDKNNLNNQLNISKDSSIITSAGNTNINNDNKNMKNINNIETPNTTIAINNNKNNSNNIFNINLELDEVDKKLVKNQENDDDINIYNKNIIRKEMNIIENKEKISKDNKIPNNKRKLPEKDKIKEKTTKTIELPQYNGKYISPFPVPGYSNDENLWCFVCDLNSKDPLDIKLEKEKEKEKQNEKISFTGIRHLLKKKDKKNNDKKNVKKGGKKNKAKKDKEKNKKH